MIETTAPLDETVNIDLPEDTRDWPFGLEVQVVDFLSGYTVSGILERFTPGAVTVVLPEAISELRAVTVRLNSFVFGGETLFCGPKGQQFEAHITIDDVEENGLRRTPRFPVRFPAQIFLTQGAPLGITIVDVSSDGLGIELPVPVEAGQPIAITSESVFVFAVVAHCRCVAPGVFRAGVEMQHLFQRPSEERIEEPRVGLLGKVFGKRLAAKRNSAVL
jgi:hypothetical protein